jgi:rubrerythrin
MDVEKLTKAYIAIRDKRAEIKKAFDAEYGDLGDKLTRLEAELLRFLQDNKTESLRTEYGTVYRQEEVKPSCADWAALDAWEKNHPEINASDIMEKRLSKKFITEYMEANDGALPPGVNIYREYVARVRRS